MSKVKLFLKVVLRYRSKCISLNSPPLMINKYWSGFIQYRGIKRNIVFLLGQRAPAVWGVKEAWFKCKFRPISTSRKLSLPSELCWAALGVFDCVDKSASVNHHISMCTQCNVWRYQNVLGFFGEVCVKAWRGEGVVLYSGVHQLMGVFNAQPTKSCTPCYDHLAKPVNTTGLRSWLSDPSADSS